MFTCQFKCLVSIDYNFSPYLRDGFANDATLLDTAGCWDAAAEYLGDTGDTIDQMLFLLGLAQLNLIARCDTCNVQRYSMFIKAMVG